MKRLILSGGGTGGHIYPALSIAREVTKRYPGVEIAYIGTRNGLESKIVTKEENIKFYHVEVQGFRRKISWANIQALFKFIKAVRRSRDYLREFSPDVVIGTGGYVSGPALFAAYQLKIATIIHEQNVIPGLTTKFLSRFVDLVAISFKESEKYLKNTRRVILTGNPRGTEVVQAISQDGVEPLCRRKKNILIFGGSRGARAINQAVLQIIPYLKKEDDIKIVYVTGEDHFEEICSQISTQEIPNLDIRPFIYNMPKALGDSYLVVSRAGASTIAELTALGLPSILIPSPNVTNNHQEANARWLEKHGATKMILEKECTGVKLWNVIGELIKDPKKYQLMREAALKIGYPQAAELLVDEIEKILSSSD